MLKEEKERNFEQSKSVREKIHKERLDLDQKLDELRLEVNRKDDQIRRLEFEIEKSSKLSQAQLG